MTSPPDRDHDLRDSGIEWLGAIPVHWETARLATSVEKCIAGTWGLEPNGTDDLVCIRVADFNRSRLRVSLDNLTIRAVPPGEREGRTLGRGDLLLEKSGGGEKQPVGAVMLYDHDCAAVCSNFLARISVSGRCDPYYLTYLHSHLYAIRLNVRSIKQTTGIQNLDVSSYLGERVGFPPLPEQRAIVQFLDHADRRIQRYIRAKERLIELLEEQKQAIIHQAVTGQINVRTGQPYPAYKDSSVGWLGPIPVHWERCRLRNVVSEVTTGSRGWSSYAADEGPLFVRVANLSRGSLELRFDDIVRLDLPSTSEASRTRIRENDLLLSVTAYIGAVGVVPLGFEEAYVSQHVARCKPLRRVHAKWLGYVLLSSIGQTHGQMCLYGGTKDGLSLEDVRNYPILIPPRDEQDRLVRWIDRELALLTIMGDQTDKQIDLLHEYRTRLVADVVTGKLDVREAAASLPETDPLIADDSDNNPKTNVTTHGDFPNFAHPHP